MGGEGGGEGRERKGRNDMTRKEVGEETTGESMVQTSCGPNPLRVRRTDTAQYLLQAGNVRPRA